MEETLHEIETWRRRRRQMTFVPHARPRDCRRNPILLIHVLYQSASVNPIVLCYLCGTEKAEPVLCPLRTLGRNHSYLVRNKLKEKPVGGGI